MSKWNNSIRLSWWYFGLGFCIHPERIPNSRRGKYSSYIFGHKYGFRLNITLLFFEVTIYILYFVKKSNK